MLTVSNYHYVRDNFKTKYPSIFGVTPALLTKQLLLLKNEGSFIKINDLSSNFIDVLYSNDNFFLITFDDGLKEQYDNALPILDKFDIPAVFFANSMNFEEKKVSTVHKIHLLRSVISSKVFSNYLTDVLKDNFTNSDKRKSHLTYRYDKKNIAELKYKLNFKIPFELMEKIIDKLFNELFSENNVLAELYMSEQNIIDLAHKGYLGSHSHSHLPIGLLNSIRIKFELEHSKLYFEELTNSKIEMVAYPYGTDETCTNEVATIAKNIGYKMGFTTKKGINTCIENHLLLNRFNCNDLPGGKNYK